MDEAVGVIQFLHLQYSDFFSALSFSQSLVWLWLNGRGSHDRPSKKLDSGARAENM